MTTSDDNNKELRSRAYASATRSQRGKRDDLSAATMRGKRAGVGGGVDGSGQWWEKELFLYQDLRGIM